MSAGADPEWQFYRRMPVYLADGRLLGRTVEIAHAVDWLHVQQGRRLLRDWYIPVAAVDTVAAEGVHLNVNLAALRARRWNVPPVEYLLEQGATPGYEYTSPKDLPAKVQTTSPRDEGRANGPRVTTEMVIHAHE